MLPQVALMALTGGLQLATIRPLHGRVNKVNTIQFFGAFFNILIDKNLLRKRNANRDVRVLFVSSIIGGASFGYWVYSNTSEVGGAGTTLLLCASMKAFIIAPLLLGMPIKPMDMNFTTRT